MSRPESISDVDFIRAIKRSNFYNPKTKKWVSNRESREEVNAITILSRRTFFRKIRTVLKNNYLIPTETAGVYIVNE